MPNWCDNTARLYHPNKDRIDALYNELTRTDQETQPFQHLHPMPPEQEENWYMWHVENWGTKWDVTPDQFLRDDDNTIILYFQSAWAPPIELYKYLVNNGWQVEALYSEPGCGFVGRFVEGFDECYEYDLADLDSINEIPDELIEWGDLISAHNDFVEQED